MNFHLLPLYFVLVGVANASTIKICVQTKRNRKTTPLMDAAVKCFDEDIIALPNMTDKVKTDSYGCAILTYKKKTPKWYNPCAGWDCIPFQNPDIFCEVTKAGFHHYDTVIKVDWNQDTTANFGTVTLEHLPHIKMCVHEKKEGKTVPLSGATVKCSDDDIGRNDNAMTTGKTGSNGCVTLSYEEWEPLPLVSPCGWDCFTNTNPDIYCAVTNSSVYPFYTDHNEDWDQKKTAKFGVVVTYPDRSGDKGETEGCGTSTPWPGNTVLEKYHGDFDKVCNNHDKCYCNCGETQANCDWEFGALLNSTCNKLGYKSAVAHPLINDCKAWANGMYGVARTSGLEKYNKIHGDCCT